MRALSGYFLPLRSKWLKSVQCATLVSWDLKSAKTNGYGTHVIPMKIYFTTLKLQA